MSRLCIVLNFAAKYREGIFTLIDREYDCDWYFGDNGKDIKGMDLSLLHRVNLIKTRWLFGNWYWQPGIPALLHKYDHFLVLGEPYCLSTWVLAWTAFFIPRKKVYYWTHGWYGRESRLKKIIKKMFFKPADGIFLYGNYARSLMMKEGYSEEKMFVLHNSLNYDKQLQLRNNTTMTDVYKRHFGNDYKTLIFIGRLTVEKRIDLLLEAVTTLKNRGQRYNVVLVGDGTARQQSEQLAKKLGINVWFYGACYDEPTNAGLIYNADLCVSPGNVGLTAVHSMMFGTPVVTHDNFPFQMPEFETIIEGKTGAFFKQNDVESLALVIENWFSTHGNDRESVRKACYKEIDTAWTPRFQLDVIKENMQF